MVVWLGGGWGHRACDTQRALSCGGAVQGHFARSTREALHNAAHNSLLLAPLSQQTVFNPTPNPVALRRNAANTNTGKLSWRTKQACTIADRSLACCGRSSCYYSQPVSHSLPVRAPRGESRANARGTAPNALFPHKPPFQRDDRCVVAGWCAKRLGMTRIVACPGRLLHEMYTYARPVRGANSSRVMHSGTFDGGMRICADGDRDPEHIM